MTRYEDKLIMSIYTHKESVRKMLKQFDEAMLAAGANADDSGIYKQLDSIRGTVKRFDETMLAAAATAADRGIDTLLAAIVRIPLRIENALPELVTDSAIARILEALRFIDSELNSYLSSRNIVHLTNALEAGIDNLYLALRDSFGLWQRGKGEPRIRRLGLRLGIPDIGGHPASYPVLKILVDGHPMLNARGRYRYTEWRPADILGPDAPLLPAEPARRVALYVDSTGGPMSGCITALITTYGDHVAWNDFRRFEGVYHAPTIQPSPEGGDWRINIPGVDFDADQYRAEVQRASTERAWEAEPWQTALLLDKYLRADPRALGGMWNPGWAEPHGEGTGMFSVTVWDDHDDHGLIVDLAASPGTPEQQARTMADFLMTTPPDQWPAARHIRRDTNPQRNPASGQSGWAASDDPDA